jgi:hypothetical protein
MPTPDNLIAIRSGFAKAGIVFESDGKSVGVKLNIRRSAPLRGLHRKPQ